MASNPDQGQDSGQGLDSDDGAPSYSDAASTPPVTYFQDLGYGPSPADHRSLRDKISQLPEQYINVITHPWTGVFIAEKGKADWNIVWIQLLGNAVIAGLLGFLSMLIPFVSQSNATGTGTGIQSPVVVHALNLSTTIGLIVFIPAIFFIGSSILRLLARAFGGY